ncbi:MAG: ABC transporter ATP-binding protein, partial [Bacteroidales bacterium]|nr:ABC transporter ATP-binding protein [Bacteroidales bacterium]
MKTFWKILVRYVKPYSGCLWGSVIMNLLAAVFNVFSFSLLIPILKILFNVETAEYTFTPWYPGMPFNEIAENAYYYVSQNIATMGASRILLILCLVFCGITLIKTACYFGASAVMVPIRTGIVRDLRLEIYDKILGLPIGFFSQERKGDIIARMSGDVQEVENSITSTLEMLIKNPILIIIYMYVLFRMSWQLTVFTIIFAPVVIFIMSSIGRRLRADSKEAQQYWSDTMSQVDETLGGLRVIKAFIAEKKMSSRFGEITDRMRRKNGQVATRQASAHPVSEFLGSVMIAIVLWYGGHLILGDRAVIDAPSFLAYIAIMYSVIQPIKDLSKAAYGIPKGLASMERIEVILNAVNDISEKENPQGLTGFNDCIRFENIRFSYSDGKEVLRGIDLEIPKGKTVAIVGASGAGKTTLVDLIPRFDDSTEGRST